jgi:hypothetical protein
MSIGLESANPDAFIQWTLPTSGFSGIFSNILVANIPQLILSTIYYSYNSLFTCFLLGREWDSYANSRKGLRVSDFPEGSQRSTYFLQIPYRFAIPLLIFSGTLHWLCSQGLFLVSLEVQEETVSVVGQRTGTYGIYHGDDFSDQPTEYLTCGYSPIAILLATVVCLFLIGTIVALGKRKFRNGMPVAGTSSVAISAACHLRKGEKGEEAAFLPLQWGVTEAAGDGLDEAGHCAFSSRPVEPPIPGSFYGDLIQDRRGLKKKGSFHTLVEQEGH